MSTVTYRNLLTQYAPTPIHSKKEYQRALAKLEELMVPNPGKARSLLIELLSTLIEKYESQEYPTPDIDPSEVLAHLLASRSIKPAVVAKETGIPPATLSNVLAHRRGISKQNAVRLGNYFGLSPVVFLANVESRRQRVTGER